MILYVSTRGLVYEDYKRAFNTRTSAPHLQHFPVTETGEMLLPSMTHFLRVWRTSKELKHIVLRKFMKSRYVRNARLSARENAFVIVLRKKRNLSSSVSPIVSWFVTNVPRTISEERWESSYRPTTSRLLLMEQIKLHTPCLILLPKTKQCPRHTSCLCI